MRASGLAARVEPRASIRPVVGVVRDAQVSRLGRTDEPYVFLPAGPAHTGDFFGLPPTGRHVEVQLALLMKVADGVVVEERRIYDFTGVPVQVGVLKAKPVA